MSKVSFRARALDATKPMPVFKAEEIPDLPDFATINRSVPQMPTGMEKEEETEHHLQRALSAQQVYGTSEALVIPIPEVGSINERYEQLYNKSFKQPKQYVHVQAFGMDQEIPDYDMDVEDELWFLEQAKKMEITAFQFEQMMDRLEKGSGQQVVTLYEAKLLLKEDDDLIIAVYDYWLNKRLRTQHPLLWQVKTEKRDGSTTNNPYVAFRRRTEKMQTRKNRKNDEVSYEKMLKLRRDLSRAVTLLEVIKRREKTKKESLQLTIEIVEKRYQCEDYSAELLAAAEAQRHTRPSFIPPYPLGRHGNWATNGDGSIPIRKKREYKKRKHRTSLSGSQSVSTSAHQSLHYADVDIMHADVYSSEDDAMSTGMSPSDHEDETDPDGSFAFRRKKFCSYSAPLLHKPGSWPWCSPDEGGLGDKKYRYSLLSLPEPPRCVGFGRRRVGRGGRILIDRGFSPWDDCLERLDMSSGASTVSSPWGDYTTYIRERKIPHYRPKTPPLSEPSVFDNSSPIVAPSILEFNLESFQSHQEQLLQMQREQQEALMRQDAASLDNSFSLEHSFSSQPTSRFTLDSDSAKFAVSAVMNSSQLQPTVAPPSASSKVLVHATLTNGPAKEANSGFSTSPADTVLQLNYPISAPLPVDSPVSVSSSVSSTIISTATALTSSALIAMATSNTATVHSTTSSFHTVHKAATKTVNTSNSAILKLATQTSNSLEPLSKQTHDDVLRTLCNDSVVALDVT